MDLVLSYPGVFIAIGLVVFCLYKLFWELGKQIYYRRLRKCQHVDTFEEESD